MLSSRRKRIVALLLALFMFLLVAIPMLTQFQSPSNLINMMATYEDSFSGTSQPIGSPIATSSTTFGTPMATATS